MVPGTITLEFQIAYKLQDLQYQQIQRLKAYREALIEHMTGKVQELNRENFAVRQHLKYVDLYANKDNYNVLTYEDTLLVREELAPLIGPEPDDASALRFDALMYGIELACLVGKKYTRARHDLITKVADIASVANIPEIMAQSELIDKILHTDYVENAGINEFEHIRENLRDLMKYLPKKKIRYDTDFDDQILSDYYRYKIGAALIAVIIIITFARMLYEGQKDYLLDVCVVIDNDSDCSDWFREFENELDDGYKGCIHLNQDQPFDYDNKYYYVQELEVMTTVSSYRMDAAICGPDMYSYLLAINACMRLDEVLPDNMAAKLQKENRLVYSTANIQILENGEEDTSDATEGFFAVDLTGTAFEQEYNYPAEGKEKEPLYAVIISNTDNLPDSVKLIEKLAD